MRIFDDVRSVCPCPQTSPFDVCCTRCRFQHDSYMSIVSDGSYTLKQISDIRRIYVIDANMSGLMYVFSSNLKNIFIVLQLCNDRLEHVCVDVSCFDVKFEKYLAII